MEKVGAAVERERTKGFEAPLTRMVVAGNVMVTRRWDEKMGVDNECTLALHYDSIGRRPKSLHSAEQAES
jgi:hypothetical protein